MLASLGAQFVGRYGEEAILFYLLVAVVYWCFGAQLSVFATTSADFFGTRYLGLNYGLLFTAYGVAGVIGPLIAGRVFDAFNDFFTVGLLHVTIECCCRIATGLEFFGDLSRIGFGARKDKRGIDVFHFEKAR